MTENRKYSGSGSGRGTAGGGSVRNTSGSSARSAAAAARKKARRRRAIRNRIIFAAVILLLLAAIVFVGMKLFGKGKGGDKPSQPADPSAQASSDVPSTEAVPDFSDTTAPVIEGVSLTRTVFAGDTVSYKQGVTVTDDRDENPQLEIDNSQVDLNTPGEYQVIYKAADAAGNVSTVTATVIVAEKPTDPATPEEEAYMKYLAGLYIDTIREQYGLTDDSSKYDWARAIWLWVNWESSYAATSDKSSWIKGAIQYFDTHKGDCFNYYAAAKALLNEVGIDNIDVVKSDTSHSSHYWLLVDVGDGWYHYDATPREGEGDYFFLVTDDQLIAYSEAHENSHIFDRTLYPATNTKVITDMNAQPDHNGN